MSEKQPLVSGAGEPSAPPPVAPPYPEQPPAYSPQAAHSAPYPPSQAPTFVAPPPGAYLGYNAAPPPGAYPGYSAIPPQGVYSGCCAPPRLPPGGCHAGANITVVQGRQVVGGGCGSPRVFVEVKPPTYVFMSVIVLLFFNLPLGLIALFHSLQVDSAWNAGDRSRARLHSQRARMWNIAGILFGIVIFIIVIVIVIINTSLTSV